MTADRGFGVVGAPDRPRRGAGCGGVRGGVHTGRGDDCGSGFQGFGVSGSGFWGFGVSGSGSGARGVQRRLGGTRQ